MTGNTALFQMLGAEDEGQAILRVTNYESFTASAREAVGATDAPSALVAIQANAKLVASVLALTDKPVEEAVGVIQAWKQSHVALSEATKKLSDAEAELQSLKNSTELEKFIAQAKAENKLTPALEESIRNQVAAKDISLKGAEALLKTLHPIKALQTVEQSETVSSGTDAAEATPKNLEGKSWGELSGAERVQLRKHNQQAYDALKKAAGL